MLSKKEHLRFRWKCTDRNQGMRVCHFISEELRQPKYRCDQMNMQVQAKGENFTLDVTTEDALAVIKMYTEEMVMAHHVTGPLTEQYGAENVIYDPATLVLTFKPSFGETHEKRLLSGLMSMISGLYSENLTNMRELYIREAEIKEIEQSLQAIDYKHNTLLNLRLLPAFMHHVNEQIELLGGDPMPIPEHNPKKFN